ncbi:MAG TPA: chemotaxis protein CheW [Rhodanobacteraceae bacterium]
MSRRHHRPPTGVPATRASVEPSAADTVEVAVTAAEPAQEAYALLADYERRSRAHDPGLPEQIDAPGLWRALGFRVGEHQFASGIDEVNEILLSPPPVTSVPATRPWLLGVANVRGNLIALVDLKQFLFGQRTHVTSRARVLVVKQAGGNVGLLVDELSGQRSLAAADQARVEPETDTRLARFVTGSVTFGVTRMGRFSMAGLTHDEEFQHAAL